MNHATLPVALFLLTFCANCRENTSTPPVAAVRDASPMVVPAVTAPKKNYALALDPVVVRLEQEMQIQRERANADPKDWIAFESIATKALDRAKVTGDYNDYKTADEALNDSFKRAMKGSGPLWVKANLDFTLHRIDAAAKDLDAVEHQAVLPYAQRLGAMTMRARIAYFRGAYKESLKLLDLMKPQDVTSGEYVAREEVLAHTGHVDDARKTLSTALAAKGASTSFLELAYGLLELDAGRYEDAQKHYENALKDSPSYWLYEEHLAEILAKQGKLDAAGLHYVELIRRTENPEFMDALAEIYEQKKETKRAQDLRTKAHALFEERLRMFPEASAGHALEHYFSYDPKRTVDLALANQKTRPYGDSGVLLAKAYLVNDKLPEAKTAIEAVLATEWNTPKLHAVAAQIFEKLKDPRASAERKKALAMNPHIFDA
jgi:tetratricopeptide (TPR) repeat protein